MGKKREGLDRLWERVTPHSFPLPDTAQILLPTFFGLRSASVSTTPCFVISDSWPGWMAILPSFAFHCLYLFVPNSDAPWLPTLLQHHADCQVRSTDEHQQMLLELQQCPYGMWGREPHTVNTTLRSAKSMIQQWNKVDLSPQFPPLGPFPVGDSLGIGVAVAMLLKSLEPGRYNTTYQQFETVRKLQAGYSNIYMALCDGVSSLRTVGGDKVKHHLTYSSTQSKWFEIFSLGCVRRMGQDVRQDWAIPLPAMYGLINILEKEWSQTEKATE